MQIIQGMAGILPIKITDGDGEVLDLANVSKIEFCIGSLRKLYLPDNAGAVHYDAETQTFGFALTEEDTLNMDDAVQYQFRVMFANGTILPSIPEAISVIKSSIAIEPLA